MSWSDIAQSEETQVDHNHTFKIWQNDCSIEPLKSPLCQISSESLSDIVQSEDVFNSSTPGQSGRPLADNVFRCIFINENFCILIKIALKYVSKGPIENNPELV